MNYYKITQNDKFIGVGSSSDLRYYQRKHNSIMACEEDHAEYIQVGDELYRDTWMLLPDNNVVRYSMATVAEISKEEYDALSSAKTVEMLLAPEPIEEEVAPTEPDEYVEYVRQMKIQQLSMACNEAIVGGFDYNGQHYSLTIEDQIELQSLVFQATQNPYGKFPYHADNSTYEELTSEEVLALYDAANSWKNSQRLYFNQLKQYVLGLSTMEEINSIQYGMEIPD